MAVLKGMHLWRRCVGRVLQAVAQGEAELMVASHNQDSVAAATRAMHALGLQPSTSGELPAPCKTALFPCDCNHW